MQEKESEAFKSYFPSEIEFLEGGYVDHSNNLLVYVICHMIIIGLSRDSEKYSRRSTNTDFYSSKGQRYTIICVHCSDSF